MLERRLAPGPRREHDDARIVPIRRRLGSGIAQRHTKGAEERREPMHLGIAVQARKHPGDDDAVLQGVTRAGRSLRPVAHGDVATGNVPRNVRRVHDEPRRGPSTRTDLIARPKKARMAVDELDREETPTDEVTRSVEVGEDQIEQLGTIDDPGFDGRPLRAGEHDGQRIERPASSPRIRRPEGVVGHAVGVEEPIDVALTADELVVAQLGKCGTNV